MPGLIASGRSNQAATQAATPRLVAIRKCLVYACRRYLCPRVSGGNPSIPDRMHTSSCVSLGLPHQDTGSEQYGTAFRSTPGDRHLAPIPVHETRARLRRVRLTRVRERPGKADFAKENDPWW